MGCLWQRDAAVAGNKQDAHQFEKRDVPLLCIQIGPTQFDRPLSRTSVGLKRPRDAAYSCPLVRRIFPTLSLNCSRRSSRTSVRIERADPLNHPLFSIIVAPKQSSWESITRIVHTAWQPHWWSWIMLKYLMWSWGPLWFISPVTWRVSFRRVLSDQCYNTSGVLYFL